MMIFSLTYLSKIIDCRFDIQYVGFLPTPHLMDDDGNQTQGDSATSVTHGGLRRRGRLRSIVWEHFEKKEINGINKAVCNYCNNALVARSTDGTKHLHNH